jgi:NADH:ubiquinone oxidoreductase subunit K
VIFPVDHALFLGAFLFALGLFIIVTKRNTIMVLLGIELLLNASNLNLIAFNQLRPGSVDGQMFVLFVIIVAVCEAAVGLAIVLQVYQYFNTSAPDSISEIKD